MAEEEQQSVEKKKEESFRSCQVTSGMGTLNDGPEYIPIGQQSEVNSGLSNFQMV